MTGVAWLLLGAASGVLAIVFGAGVGVPVVRRAGGPACRGRGRHRRWGHALVWALLALMFVALASGATSETLVAPLGLAALATYVTFLVTLLRSAGRRRRRR